MSVKTRSAYLRWIERRQAEAIASDIAVEYSMLVETEIPKLIKLARESRPDLTTEECRAFRMLFAYLEPERKHYESDPSKDHIWRQVQVAQKAIERIKGGESK